MKHLGGGKRWHIGEKKWNMLENIFLPRSRLIQFLVIAEVGSQRQSNCAVRNIFLFFIGSFCSLLVAHIHSDRCMGGFICPQLVLGYGIWCFWFAVRWVPVGYVNYARYTGTQQEGALVIAEIVWTISFAFVALA